MRVPPGGVHIDILFLVTRGKGDALIIEPVIEPRGFLEGLDTSFDRKAGGGD